MCFATTSSRKDDMTEGEVPTVPEPQGPSQQPKDIDVSAYLNHFTKFAETRADGQSDIRSKVTVIEESDITFDQVGGNGKAKKELRELARIMKGSQAHRAMGATADRGYLLWGPSGNGKTELARALAHETGAIVIVVNYQDLASKWVNETAENIRKLFQFAREEAARTGRPVIIFFDEADALFISRETESAHSMHTTALAALLTEMDGAHANNENIYVIGATNRAEGIDPAARRRFEHKIAVPNPDASDRVEILHIHSNKARALSADNGYHAVIFADASDPTYWQRVAAATEGFSGAQLATLIHRATRFAAGKLQQAMEKAGFDDVDEFLSAYPDALTTITVSADEMVALAQEVQREETSAVSSGQEEHRPYHGTGNGYFGSN